MGRREGISRYGRSFAGGAVVLAASNVVCRLLGFLFKIPLANLIGREGMGYFSFAYQIFGVVTVAAVSGIPVALSRIVAERTLGGLERQNGVSILKQATALFSTAGLAASAVLLAFSRVISRTAGSEPSWYCVAVLAPSAFFVSMTAAFRGYYQGLADMVPTAVSQIADAVFKLVIGVAAAYYLYENACPPEIVAAGAVAGVTVGSAIGFAVLTIVGKRRERIKRSGVNKERERGIKRRIILTALPITAGAFLSSLINIIDAMLIMNRLQAAGFSPTAATELYGAYTGYAVTLHTLPFALTSAIAASIIPVVAASASRASAGKARLKKSVNTALRLTSIISFPCAALFCLMPQQLLSLMFSRASDVRMAAPLLAELAVATALAALSSVTSAILQAAGWTNIPVIAAVAGGVAKLASNYFLIGIEKVNISGAPIGTTVYCLIVFAVNLAAIVKKFGFMPKVSDFLLKPAACGGLAAFTAYWIYKGLTPYLSGATSVLTGLLAAGAVYITVLILTGAVNGEDRSLLPHYSRR